jgi:hypothetical protein
MLGPLERADLNYWTLCQYRLGYFLSALFKALTMVMFIPTPQTARRLLAVHPYVAKTLTIVALC